MIAKCHLPIATVSTEELNTTLVSQAWCGKTKKYMTSTNAQKAKISTLYLKKYIAVKGNGETGFFVLI